MMSWSSVSMSNDEREYVYCLIMRLSSVSMSNDERMSNDEHE